uniref:Fringe n=1 Tax=Solanum tuberosum TaxID=4113 RepID=M1CXX1_SOLTU
PTNLNHLLFGLLGSEEAWHFRKEYIESWWRPNKTRGYLFLDVAPTGDDLLPWSSSSPPYRVSDNITQLIEETKHVAPTMARMVHGIMEVFREDHEGVRWVVMGDDDSIFFVDNMVDVLARYDHTKYYYLGGQSEFIMSNHWYSFNQAFGGAGFILSYPLAKAMSKYIESCLRRYPFLRSADQITMVCISDVGVILTPLKGSHQIDLRGDISGLLSSHPKAPLMSLHHLDATDSIFPSIERRQSVRHLMKAANLDQSRMLQQVICYNRPSNWSFSISWGYSVHIYENILPRSHLQLPIETFQPWGVTPKDPPYYMLNTRWRTNDSCEAPHVFFMKNVEKTKRYEILTTYSRSSPRELLSCSYSGNHSADYISKIEVYSPRRKRIEVPRGENLGFKRSLSFVDFAKELRSSRVESRVLGGDPVRGGRGSEEAWHHRKPYIESWWRPNVTIGHLLLDVPPQGEDLLPWSLNSPPYRVSDDVPRLMNETNHVDPRVLRMVHGIMEVVREAHEGVRWVVMGDDDSIFFVDNMVDILAQYDHTKYYYFGGHSEFIMANYFFSFHQAFGGAGIILSYPLARAFANNVISCLKRYAFFRSADRTTMSCTADIGVNLSPLMGSHQSIEKTPQNKILTKYIRAWPRGIGVCLYPGSYPAEYVNEIHVYSPATKRLQINRCECCDVIHKAGSFKAAVRYRECKLDEIIA